ncbi:Uncharacterised protein [Bordetella pertussis]|nr:Uncharacterised protein [Bordetella pertussis]CFV97139.1 Uncharacterised protein [Bordetella pertussis]
MNSCAPASRAAATTSCMLAPGRVSAMLSRTLRLNSVLSCSTTPSWRRSEALSTMPMSWPSISTRPRSATNMRCISRVSVLLPDPERPTTPTTSPGAMRRLTLRSASAASGR